MYIPVSPACLNAISCANFVAPACSAAVARCISSIMATTNPVAPIVFIFWINSVKLGSASTKSLNCGESTPISKFIFVNKTCSALLARVVSASTYDFGIS